MLFVIGMRLARTSLSQVRGGGGEAVAAISALLLYKISVYKFDCTTVRHLLVLGTRLKITVYSIEIYVSR